jgi:hypothetical protein
MSDAFPRLAPRRWNTRYVACSSQEHWPTQQFTLHFQRNHKRPQLQRLQVQHRSLDVQQAA